VSAKALSRLLAAFSQVETREGSRLRDGALFMHMGGIVKGLDIHELAQEPRLLANIVNAFAKARVWDEELFRYLSRAARLTAAAHMLPSDCGALVGELRFEMGYAACEGFLKLRQSPSVSARVPLSVYPPYPPCVCFRFYRYY
jgi:hypothetical protein